MTTALEIIKTASTLIPEFDGNSDHLSRVINAIKALSTVVTEATKVTAIQVILSKLSGKARSAVGENPQEIQEIIDGLQAKCSNICQPEVILAKLDNERQTADLTKFTEQIEKLTLQLENAYIAERVPLATASRLALRAGTKALANGLKNKETQLIIKAGKFDTLTEVISKANENEKSTGNNAVFYYRGQSQYHARGGQRGRNTRGHTPRGGYPNRGRYNSGRNDFNSPRGRSYAHWGNGRGNGRGGHQHYPGESFRPNNRVFYAQQGNTNVPQPFVGGITGITGMTGITPGQVPHQTTNQVQNPQIALANITRH